MTTRTVRPFSMARALLVLLVMGTTVIGVQPAAAKDGNSANAKLCQKGGYATLAAVIEGVWARFATEEACVSAAAQGATLQPYVEPVLTGTLGVDGRSIEFQGAGLLPGAFLTITTYRSDTTPITQEATVAGDGTFSQTASFPCATDRVSTGMEVASTTVFGDPITTGAITLTACPTPLLSCTLGADGRSVQFQGAGLLPGAPWTITFYRSATTPTTQEVTVGPSSAFTQGYSFQCQYTPTFTGMEMASTTLYGDPISTGPIMFTPC